MVYATVVQSRGTLAEQSARLFYRLVVPNANRVSVDADGAEHDEQFEATVGRPVEHVVMLAAAHHLPCHAQHTPQPVVLQSMALQELQSL